MLALAVDQVKQQTMNYEHWMRSVLKRDSGIPLSLFRNLATLEGRPASIGGCFAELRFDAQQAVVFGDPI